MTTDMLLEVEVATTGGTTTDDHTVENETGMMTGIVNGQFLLSPFLPAYISAYLTEARDTRSLLDDEMMTDMSASVPPGMSDSASSHVRVQSS